MECKGGIFLWSKTGKLKERRVFYKFENSDFRLSASELVIIMNLSSSSWTEIMVTRSQAWFFLSFVLFFSTINHLSSAADTISSGQSLTFGQTLSSKGGIFELGFFRPGNSYSYYIGIWYKKISVENRTYVWVANRDTPLVDPTSSGLKLLADGNLVLYRNSNLAFWSTNSTSNAMNSSEAVLGDDGNFVLRNRIRPSDVFWQSFDYPTDTLLPGGRFGYNKRTKKSNVLTSWKNPNDPSKGSFSVELDPNGDQSLIKLNRTETYWSSGPWNGQIFTAVPEMKSNNAYNYSFFKNENESYFTYNVYNNTSIISRYVIDWSGQENQMSWDEATQQWFLLWFQPRHQCDVYAFCGAFGVCNQNGSAFCSCIEGFEPRSQKDWNMSDFSGGCVRKNSLHCGDRERFLLMSNVSLLVNQQVLAVASAEECKLACSNNCSCSAYAYRTECYIWNGNLSCLRQLSDGYEDGSNLYLRYPASDLQNSGDMNFGGKKKGAKTGVIIGAVASVLVLGLIASYIGFKKRPNRKGNIIMSSRDAASTNEDTKEDFELPLFDLPTIAIATNQFSFSNKIGQGGFGPVFKGVLPMGEEIAIKRLSKDSRQGRQEFMNEVELIAKLQHRNLVRLLGFCIQGEERMLIYEYMPNKSLDFFIFDETRRVKLDWNKRFNIIIGIARGLLYLHRDSRLRIIHRDLKAGNVLLDSQMNPKISDFGMARIFGAEQTKENTTRVVGTYGYMSPEYAIEGLFSTKSDVFSFGVLVLEIVSGKKNRGFHHKDHDLNLLGHTWKLLYDNKTLELLDASIKSSFTFSEVLKCIQVGLLCVQNSPEDRPEISYVLSMLDGDGDKLPWPKEPGFYNERSAFEKVSSLTIDGAFPSNEVTVTLPEGR